MGCATSHDVQTPSSSAEARHRHCQFSDDDCASNASSSDCGSDAGGHFRAPTHGASPATAQKRRRAAHRQRKDAYLAFVRALDDARSTHSSDTLHTPTSEETPTLPGTPQDESL